MEEKKKLEDIIKEWAGVEDAETNKEDWVILVANGTVVPEIVKDRDELKRAIVSSAAIGIEVEVFKYEGKAELDLPYTIGE